MYVYENYIKTTLTGAFEAAKDRLNVISNKKTKNKTDCKGNISCIFISEIYYVSY